MVAVVWEALVVAAVVEPAVGGAAEVGPVVVMVAVVWADLVVAADVVGTYVSGGPWSRVVG